MRFLAAGRALGLDVLAIQTLKLHAREARLWKLPDPYPRRLHAGQTKPTRVVRLLVANTVEQRVLELQKAKGTAAEQRHVAGILRAARTEVDSSELMKVFKKDLAGAQPTANASASNPGAAIASTSNPRAAIASASNPGATIASASNPGAASASASASNPSSWNPAPWNPEPWNPPT